MRFKIDCGFPTYRYIGSKSNQSPFAEPDDYQAARLQNRYEALFD